MFLKKLGAMTKKPYNNGRRKLNQLPYLNLIGSIRKVDLPEESSQTGYL